MATKKFNELTTSTTLNNTDFIVGYANTSPGGERRWQYSVIRNEISQYLPLSGGTLTNNLSVGGVVSSSGGNSNNWNKAYNIGTAYSLVSSTFLTSESDSQTLSFNELNKNLSISNGNTVSLSALLDDTGVDTEVRSLTANWQDASTVVQNNSANWDAAFGSAGADLAVRSLTANWESTYTTFKDISSTFLTSETDSQTLSFNEISKDLSISNGNTVSLSALVGLGGSGTDTEVRTLTSTWQDASTVVQNNSANWDAAFGSAGADLAVRSLTANWESTYLTVKSLSSSWEESLEILPTVTNYLSTQNVLVSSMTITDSLSVVGGINLKLNGDPALYVGFDKIGVNTEFPNHELTVVGNISATGLLYGDGSNLTGIVAGDKEATTLVRTNSAQWASNVDTGVRALTGNWDSTYTTVQTKSATEWDNSLAYAYSRTNFLPLTGGILTGNLTVSTTISAQSNIFIGGNQSVTTPSTSVPGISAITSIVAVSALPASPNPNTLYIII